MSRDRPRSEYRREVEQAEEHDWDAQQTRDRSWGAGFIPFGWPTLLGRGRSEGTYGEGQYDERTSGSYGDEYERGRPRGRGGMGDGTWADEGLITLLVVAGVALFLFPEPGTSVIGMVLIGAGVLAWIVDLVT